MAKPYALQKDSPYLEVVVGPNKGRVFELGESSVKIGRGDDNDIVVPSNAVSRNHALISFLEGNYVVQDYQSKNGIQVNGLQSHEHALTDGDLVQVGDFVVRFRSPKVKSTIDEPLREPIPVIQSFGKKRSFRPILYGMLLCVGGYLYVQSQNKPQEEITQNASTLESSPDEEEKKIDSKLPAPPLPLPGKRKELVSLEDPSLTKAEQDLSKLDWFNPNVQESEQYFRRGQREYFNKSYHRAIEAFQTSLTFNRNHELANFYLKLAVYDVELEAKRHKEMAVKYFESLQYSRAIYHFGEVISLMGHRPKDPMIQEAEKYIQVAKQRLQASELFP